MSTEQQQQTHSHFGERAGQWRAFADGETGRFNVSAARHAAVLDGCAALPTAQQFLDAGCGAGQLVLEMARRGHRAVGVDFSEQMIDICKRTAALDRLDANFRCMSVFDLPRPDRPYDIISAQGLIEYISPEELGRFFRLTADYLAPGGHFFVGSRNRLFNVVSLNAYTQMELDLRTERRLIEESLLLASDMPWGSLAAYLVALPVIGVHPQQHPHTGKINVATRYQYTPAELAVQLMPLGLHLRRIYPVHYHPFPTIVLAGTLDEWHKHTAQMVAELAIKDHRLIPNSSSFVLHLSKY